MLVDVLKGCVTSGVGTGSRANFRGMEIAGKTGTNSDNVGVTFAGMSGYYSAAVIGSTTIRRWRAALLGGSERSAPVGGADGTVHYTTGCTQNRSILTKSASAVGLRRRAAAAYPA